MIQRPLWVRRIENGWERAPLVWLTGVRRIGKTTLAMALENATYLNCDLPSVARRLEDPESFYAALSTPLLILDEVHQLDDPSKILKIATDGFPKLKVLATGSSTLAATRKFRDSLAGRKRVVHLLPVLAEELAAFGIADMKRRLLHGGLPQQLLSDQLDAEFYSEWIDSYFARDIQELFRVEKRTGFLKLLEGVLRQSGSLAEITSFCKMTELTRPTVMNYLQVLEITHAVSVLRPYSAGGRRELVAQPKIYGFDSGFVAYVRGWHELRDDDCGLLWEHVVLDTLQSIPDITKIQFWRDKQQREVDFVLPRGRSTCDAIECKWNAQGFETRGLKAFRENYPKGRNFVVSPQIGDSYKRVVNGLEITFAHAAHLRKLLMGS